MTLLTYNTKYVVSSQSSINTTSTSLVDDTYSLYGGNGQITLGATQTVLVMYQSNNTYGVNTDTQGIKNAINIDTVDKANSADSGNIIPGNCMRNMCFWIGSLASGLHTIKGRFASVTGDTVTINNRVLLIYVFNGDEFQYTDNNSNTHTNSTTFVDDTFASITITPSANCKALVMYNASQGKDEIGLYLGMKTCINMSGGMGTDYSQVQKCGFGGFFPISMFTCYARSLTGGKTFKGRFASQEAPLIATINNRQFGILLIDDKSQLDFLTDNHQVNACSTQLQDDIYATISRDKIKDELLVIAAATKTNSNKCNFNGICYGISVDGVDKANSRGSDPIGRSDSVAVCWGQTIAEDEHIVQGRFSNNTCQDGASISARHIACLWFYTGPYTYTKTIDVVESNSMTLKKRLEKIPVTIVLTNTLELTKSLNAYRLMTIGLTSTVNLTKGVSKIINITQSVITGLLSTITRHPDNLKIITTNDSIEDIFETEDELAESSWND